MGQQQLFGNFQIISGSIQRDLLDITTPGESVIRKIIAGSGIILSYTGADAGTGDVTISTTGTTSGGSTSDLYWTSGSNGLGIHSLFGNTNSLGSGSFGVGMGSLASGSNSWAYGLNSKALGNQAMAGGVSSIAAGDNSSAYGSSTLASGTHSHAEGSTSKTFGVASHAEGVGTVAYGSSSHAEGNTTQAYGSSSHAEGTQTFVSGTNAFAGGNGNTVIGDNSSALGGQSNTLRANRSAILGGQNLTGNSDDTVYVPNFNIHFVQSGNLITYLAVDSSGNVISGSTPPQFAGIDQIGIYGLNQGVPLGTGTSLDVNGSRLLMSISGSRLRLSSSPDPMDNIGIYGLAQGVPLGTGTSVNIGSGLLGTISGSQINLGLSYPVSGTLVIQDEGSTLGSVNTLNFVGGGIDASLVGQTGRIFVTGSYVLSQWTPTWTNLVVGNGVVTAKYQQAGNVVQFHLELVFGNTTIISGSVSFSPPVTMASNYGNTLAPMGVARLVSAGQGYLGIVQANTTTDFRIAVNNASATYLQSTLLSATIPGTWTTSDIIDVQGFYFV